MHNHIGFSHQEWWTELRLNAESQESWVNSAVSDTASVDDAEIVIARYNLLDDVACHQRRAKLDGAKSWFPLRKPPSSSGTAKHKRLTYIPAYNPIRIFFWHNFSLVGCGCN